MAAPANDTRWRLVALPPLPAEALSAMIDNALPELPVDVVVPEDLRRAIEGEAPVDVVHGVEGPVSRRR